MSGVAEDLGRVAIIGGGVVGCFLAFRLAGEGVPVTLVEKDRPGAGATGNSAGNVQPASGDDGPEKVALGAESLHIWRKYLPAIKEETGLGLREQPVRYLYAATTDAEEPVARQTLSHLTAAGLRCEWLDGKTAREIEPRLSPSIIGGVLHQDCVQMDPIHLISALARAAELRGAEIVRGEAVGLTMGGGRLRGVALADGGTLDCTSAVVATGAWTARLLEDWLGVEAPVAPHGLQKLHLGLGEAGPLGCAVRWSGLNIVSRTDGFVHVGSRFDPDGFDSRPSAQARAWMLERVGEILPGLKAESVEGFAAFAAATPERAPLIGPLAGPSLNAEGVYLAVPSTDGFLMAALLAEALTGLLVSGTPHRLMETSPAVSLGSR